MAGDPYAAIARIGDVRMVAQASRWPGPVSISHAVTPVHVEIENGSDTELVLRHGTFALVAADGRRFAALPPIEIESEAAVPAAPLGPPRFTFSGFAIAPWYRPLYPGFPSYPRSLLYDSLYYDAYHPYWTKVQLPTTSMIEWGLPEGVLSPAGEIEGWLYFERVDEDITKVTLRADLVSAASGTAYGELRIPFVVE